MLSNKDVATSQPDLESVMDDIDRVTLYRILNTFEEKGIIHKVFDLNGTANYAMCSSNCGENHHHDEHLHFNCTVCKNVYCLDDLELPALKLPNGFKSEGFTLYANGLCPNEEPPKKAFVFKTIVIDAGHGGKDPGAHGSHTLEKNVALAIAKKLDAMIKAEMPEINVDYQKNYDGYDEHDPTSLIVLNTYMQKYRTQSILFGSILNKQFVNTDERRSRGVKEQGVLVLAHSAMPAVLRANGNRIFNSSRY
eukprot:gene15117-15260_t